MQSLVLLLLCSVNLKMKLDLEFDFTDAELDVIMQDIFSIAGNDGSCNMKGCTLLRSGALFCQVHYNQVYGEYTKNKRKESDTVIRPREIKKAKLIHSCKVKRCVQECDKSSYLCISHANMYRNGSNFNFQASFICMHEGCKRVKIWMGDYCNMHHV